MGRSSNEYGPLDSDHDREPLARIMRQAFGLDAETTLRWLLANQPHARIMRRAGALVGGLIHIPMGQFFGGRRVSMTGIAGVAVAPSDRGQGTGTALMHATVRELHRAGVALSALYPATIPLYRRAGYELAGGHHSIRVPAHLVPRSDRGLTVRPLEPGDERAVERAYRAHAATRPGWLDRGEYIWQRVRHGRDDADIHGFVVEGRKQIEGYLFYRIDDVRRPGYEVRITDMVATTPDAIHQLLGFLAGHRSLARSIVWHGSATDAFVHLVPERGCESTLLETWMLRLIDVPRALGERGYPRAVKARLDLRVSDEVVRANSGNLVLDVSDGQARVRPGGRGTLALDVRALASLYSGHATAHQLAALGLVQGTPAALDKAAAIFAGPPPSMPDSF